MKYLSSLCASSLEGRARCSRNTEPSQAFRKAVWASAGERESSIPPTIILCWRHQTLLHFPVSVALGFSAVFYVTAPLPPEARTLLAAQMVQRRCPLSWAWNTHTGGYCRAQCVFVGKVSSDYCQVLSVTSETFDLLHMCLCPSVKVCDFSWVIMNLCVCEANPHIILNETTTYGSAQTFSGWVTRYRLLSHWTPAAPAQNQLS